MFMAAIGKDAQGALLAAYDAAAGQVRVRNVGAASSTESRGREVNGILRSVVDDDGYLRVVTV